jgi:hypothetical protein
MISANTVLNISGTYHSFVDASKFASSYADNGGWSKIWPNSDFFKPVFEDPRIPVLLPRMSIMGVSNTEYWVNMGPPRRLLGSTPGYADSVSFKMTQQHGQALPEMGRRYARITHHQPHHQQQPRLSDSRPTRPPLRSSILISGLRATGTPRSCWARFSPPAAAPIAGIAARRL